MSTLLFVFSLNVAAHALESGAIRCAKVLISLAEHRRAQAYDPTPESLRELHAWRSRELSRYDFGRSDEPASGAATSETSTVQKIASRASGLLADANLARVRVLGIAIRGEEAIRREIERRMEIGMGLKTAYRARTKAQQYGAFLTSGTGIAATATLAALAPQFDSALVALPALAVPVVMLRHLPEQLYRLFQAYHPGGDELALTSMSDDASGAWAYRSYQVRVPLRSLRRIAHSSDVGAADIDDFHREVSYPLETLRRTSARLLALDPGPAPGPLDWARFDELLIRSPDDEPLLVTIVRLPFLN